MAATLSLLLPGILVFVTLGGVLRRGLRATMLTVRAKRLFISNFGLNMFLETEWARLRVPLLLRTFWATRMGLMLVAECFRLYGVSG